MLDRYNMLTASRPVDPTETSNLHQDECISAANSSVVNAATAAAISDNYINYPWINKERSSSRRQRPSHQSGKKCWNKRV